jgi:tetratricopeptide (TPR) repeat protein
MAQKLVQGGIKAVKNGETELARKAFTQALKLDPNNEAAWLGMATITDAPKDKVRILKKVLEINPANDRAQEALRRLEPEETAAPIPPPPANPFSTGMDDAPSFEDEIDLDDVPLPSASSEGSSSTTGTGKLRSLMDTGELREEAPPEEAPIPKPVTAPLILKTAAEAFAQAPHPPATGQGGIPIVNASKVRELSEAAVSDVQSYLEESLADYLTPEHVWTKKRRGRAGEGEYGVYLGQVTLGIVAFLIVAGFGAYVFVMNSPAAQKILFAPTWTPSATPTTLPTITPGVTNTPSPEPPNPPDATATLPITLTPGNPDQYFPPTATQQYYPVAVNPELIQAVDLMFKGEMDEAKELLDEEVAGVELSGDFPPFYRLSQWYLLDGDSEEARQILVDWETNFPAIAARSQSYLLTAYARVDVYEARNGLGDRGSLLAAAEERLDSVLGISNPENRIDALNEDAYILLAQVHELRGNIEQALEILDIGLGTTFQDRTLIASTSLRYEKARILGEAQRYEEALEELGLLLVVDPFNEAALVMQINLALESGQAGLAVLYAQQYLLYYPGSVQGFYLLGQAREAENKIDLALNAYSRAVAGDPTDENYTSDPFYLEALLRRAEIYTQQGDTELAAADYRLALQVSDDDELIRVRSLDSNFASGDFEAVLDVAEDLLDSGDAPRANVLFYQGRAYIQLGSEENQENYELGIEALNSAIANGLSQDESAEAQEYLARANFALGETEAALTAINAAIASEATTSRRFLRGQILEAQGNRSGRNADFEAALLDYEYVLSWGQIYSFPFLEEAQRSYDAILERLGER